MPMSRLPTSRLSTFQLSISQLSISRFFRRLVSGDHAARVRITSLRSVVAWIFIALVALFLTHPAGGPPGAPELQVPWPAELGLDGALVGGSGG